MLKRNEWLINLQILRRAWAKADPQFQILSPGCIFAVASFCLFFLSQFLIRFTASLERSNRWRPASPRYPSCAPWHPGRFRGFCRGRPAMCCKIQPCRRLGVWVWLGYLGWIEFLSLYKSKKYVIFFIDLKLNFNSRCLKKPQFSLP